MLALDDLPRMPQVDASSLSPRSMVGSSTRSQFASLPISKPDLQIEAGQRTGMRVGCVAPTEVPALAEIDGIVLRASRVFDAEVVLYGNERLFVCQSQE